MTLPILTTAITAEEDVVITRQRAHQIARLLKFENVEQTRIATAVSEIARNAYEYAGGGKVDFFIDDEATLQLFQIRISDKGKGISQLQDILEGRYESTSGMGVGIIGTRRLMDVFKIETTSEGTSVIIGKHLPKEISRISTKTIGTIVEQLAKEMPHNPVEEMQRQNKEILIALRELEKRQSELSRLNQELAETNRGVVALYAELDTRAEHAQQADAVKTRFLSHMSHEFRTPVNSVLNLTDFLINRTDGELTPEQDKQIRLIRKSMESLSEMVNDLLDLAKVEAGKVTMRIEEFTIAELFGSLRGMFRPLARNPNVELIFEEPAQTIQLRNDEGKISQILRNFISNSIKFTETGEIRVTASLDQPSAHITLTVADTGVGVARKDIARIFEEFSQIENSIQKKVRGTGLGLPLSKKLAEILGGVVSANSEPNKGSTFSVCIPLNYSEEPEVVEENMPPSRILDHSSDVRALIIDDDESTCYTLKRALTALAWSVTEANDIKRGLQIAEDKSPNLIFLDLMMPEMNGLEVLELLKSNPATVDIPVIIHTSQTLSINEQNALRQSVAGIISKNMNFDQVLGFVKGLVSQIILREAS